MDINVELVDLEHNLCKVKESKHLKSTSSDKGIDVEFDVQEVIVQESTQLPTSNDELLKIKDRLVKELQLNVIDLQQKLKLKETNKEKIENLEAKLKHWKV